MNECHSELLSIVEFEKGLIRKGVGTTPMFQINVAQKRESEITNREFAALKYSVTIDKDVIIGNFNRQFIHQIGKRVWKNKGMLEGKKTKTVIVDESDQSVDIGTQEGDNGDDYMVIFNFMLQLYREEPTDFCVQVTKALTTGDSGVPLDFIYYMKNTELVVYGFVSKVYQFENQLEFRNRFLELSQSFGEVKIEPNPDVKVKLQGGRLVEYFKFNPKMNYECELGCGIVYGLNNGYGSYRINWTRKIKETDSMLTESRAKKQFQWKNNPREIKSIDDKIEAFTKYCVNEGLGYLKYLDEAIQNSKSDTTEDAYFRSLIDDLLLSVGVAKASNDRVKAYWENKYFTNKSKFFNSRWAIVDSLSFIGNHEKAVPWQMQGLLVYVASQLLEEESLEKFLAEHKRKKCVFINEGYEWLAKA